VEPNNSNEPKNPFDELGGTVDVKEQKRLADDLKAKHDQLDYLVHKVFKQSPNGKKLLSIWEEILIMTPGAEPDMCMIEVGIKEGYKRFIRNIKLTINRVEKGK